MFLLHFGFFWALLLFGTGPLVSNWRTATFVLVSWRADSRDSSRPEVMWPHILSILLYVFLEWIERREMKGLNICGRLFVESFLHRLTLVNNTFVFVIEGFVKVKGFPVKRPSSLKHLAAAEERPVLFLLPEFRRNDASARFLCGSLFFCWWTTDAEKQRLISSEKHQRCVRKTGEK